MHIPWSKTKAKGAVETPGVDSELFNDGRSSDIIILVLGKTGAGKSTFVNAVLKSEEMMVGHGLESCTPKIQWGIIDDIPNHPLYADRRIVIVDTPGFEDSSMNDVAIFKSVSKWLEHSYSHEMKISGIVYMQDLSSDRFNDHDRKNLEIFESVCGDDALQRVIFTLTKSQRLADHGIIREKEYKERFWSHWIERGAHVMRFTCPIGTSLDEASPTAWLIIDHLLCSLLHSHVLQLQRELVDLHLSLVDTAAGKQVIRQLQQSLEKLGFAIKNHSRGPLSPESPAVQNAQLQEMLDFEHKLRKDLKEIKTTEKLLSRFFPTLSNKTS